MIENKGTTSMKSLRASTSNAEYAKNDLWFDNDPVFILPIPNPNKNYAIPTMCPNFHILWSQNRNVVGNSEKANSN